MVLSLKVDGKNYLSIKQIQRCENINQLMWMLLISVTIAVGIFFVYMMFYTYKNAEESQFEITKIKYGECNSEFYRRKVKGIYYYWCKSSYRKTGCNLKSIRKDMLKI